MGTDYTKTPPELVERVAGYENTETTRTLYGFGLMLVNEGVDRAHRLDGKAALFAGFTGTILAILAATSSSWATTPRNVWLMITVACVFGAALFSLIAMSVRKFIWFDAEEGWLARDYLETPDRLARWYVLSMYKVYRSHREVNRWKSTLIDAAHWFLIAATCSLAVAIWTAMR